MGILLTIENKLKDAVETVIGIKKYVFDDLSTINADSTDEYPLLLFKPPTSKSPDRTLEYEIMNMDLFVFDTNMSDDIHKWTEVYDVCHNLLHDVLKELFADTTFVLTGEVTYSLGRMQHNANLVGARAQFQLRVYYGC